MGNFVYINPILRGGRQKRLRASYRLNCPLPDLTRDLPMVSKFKFVRYGHIKKKFSALVPRFNFDGPRKLEVSHFQIAKFEDSLIFQLWIRILFWLYQFKSYGTRPFICVLIKGCDETKY